MDAGAFLIGDVKAQPLQVVPESPVHTDQPVLRAAGHVEPGLHRLFGHFFRQGVIVHVAAPHLIQVAEYRLVIALVGHEKIGVLLVLHHRVQNQGGGKSAHRAEGFRVLQAVDNGSKAAHGESPNEGVLPLGGEGEGAPGKVHQLLADVSAVQPAGPGVVHIEAVFPGGHYHCQVPVLRPGLQPGAADPVCFVPKDTVEQIQSLKGTLGSLSLGTRHFVRGQYHLNGNRPSQRTGHEITVKQSHKNALPFLVFCI